MNAISTAGVLALLGVIVACLAGVCMVDGRKRIAIVLAVLAAIHIAPLVVLLWVTLVFGGREV